MEPLLPPAIARATTHNQQYLHEPHVSLPKLLSAKQAQKVVSQTQISGFVYFETLLAMQALPCASKTSARIPTCIHTLNAEGRSCHMPDLLAAPPMHQYVHIGAY